MRKRMLVAVLVLAALCLSGCVASGSTTASAAPHTTSHLASATTHTFAAPRSKRPRHRPHAAARSKTLAYSTASNDVVQPQPAPGSCHAIGSGLYSRPDPACTPGALNPAVTQATIDRTICVDGWTDTARPPETITEQEKAASMAAYSATGSMGDYEYDHFVPLELGGATNDPRNLWPEPGASPNPKDTVEDDLRSEVCDGQISLAKAQHEIVANWVALAHRLPSASAPTSTSGQHPQCTVTATHDSSYNDYDVYVHSNQPDQTVTVSNTEGDTASWHTDSSGYADVYFKSGGSTPGRQITARVGQASCSTTL